MNIVPLPVHHPRRYAIGAAALRPLDRRIRRIVRAHPHPTIDQVAEAAGCDPAEVRGLLARRRDSRSGQMPYNMRRFEVLNLAAGDGMELADDPSTPPEIVGWLAVHRSTPVRERAVSRSDCPQAALMAAAADRHVSVRRAVAANEHTPSARLGLLAHYKSTRPAVARNPLAPTSLLRRLASDDDMLTRLAVANNPSCPLSVVRRLAADPRANVRSVIAGRADCPVADLRRLAGDEELNVRRSVAGNSGCPPDALRRLVTETDHEVRRVIAGNPSTPSDVVETLVDDRHRDVRDAACRRLSLGPGVEGRVLGS